MYSYGPPHMAVQKLDDQHEHTFSSYVRIRDAVLKTYLGRWTIGRSGERGSGISVLPALYDDDDDCYTSFEMTDQFFMISSSKEQLQQQLEYTLLKPDCHSWRISKIQSWREDTLEERYTIKLCFKLGKIQQKRMECFRLLFDHLAWIEHQFLSGIRDSNNPGNLW